MKIGLGLSLTNRAAYAAGFSDEATALFAAMSVQPDAARKALINSFIVALKTAGIWSELDLLYVMAAHDAQAAQLNWKAPAANTLSPQNSPTFTTDRGYQGNGTTSYLTAGTNFSALTNYQQNDAVLGVWSLTDLDHATAREAGPEGSGSSTSKPCVSV